MKHASLFVVSVLVLGLLFATIVTLKYEHGSSEVRSAMENHIPNFMVPVMNTGWTGKIMGMLFVLANFGIIFPIRKIKPRA